MTGSLIMVTDPTTASAEARLSPNRRQEYARHPQLAPQHIRPEMPVADHSSAGLPRIEPW